MSIYAFLKMDAIVVMFRNSRKGWGKQRQAYLCEFKTNLVYLVSSRLARAT